MADKKRLLVIAGGTYIFGAEKVTLAVLEGLKEKGYQMNVLISGWNDGSFAKALQNLNINFYKLKLGWYYTSKILWSLDSLIHYPGAVLRFIGLQKKISHDFVYIISFRQVILLWPFFKKNIIYHIHDPYSNSKQARFFLKMIDKKVVRYIAVSDFIKQDLIKCGISPMKIEVIHNGVAVEKNVNIEPIESEDLKIGIVGQVIPRKGHEDVIEALKILTDKGFNNIIVKIVGNGDAEFEKKLKVSIAGYGLQNKFYWEGFKNSRNEIFAGIDIVIVPTRNDEPFALVPLEANALSKLAIVSDRGGFPEMIVDGYNGFIVKSNSSEQIAKKIEEILLNKEMRITMGKNGATRVSQYFTTEIMNEKVHQLINNL